MGRGLTLKVPIFPRSKELLNKLIDRESNRLFNVLYEPCIAEARARTISRFGKVFDKMIDQYYEYKTKRYYRHETGRGTGTGVNLYRAYHAKFKEGFDKNTFGYLIDAEELSGEDEKKKEDDKIIKNEMEPYKSLNGTVQPPGPILEYIMEGGRSMPPFTHIGASYIQAAIQRSPNYPTSWAPNFNDELFGHISGQPYKALKDAIKEVPEVLKNYFWQEANARLKSIQIKWV